MSQAFKCDICGAYFEDNSGKFDNHTISLPCNAIKDIDVLKNSFTKYRLDEQVCYADICPECQSAVVGILCSLSNKNTKEDNNG